MIEKGEARDQRIEARRRTAEERLEASISLHALHPERIEERLRELDEEWSVERRLQANASTLSLAGLVLGGMGWRRMLLLPIVAQGFLLQHAWKGWCPPSLVLQRLGLRTRREIDRERLALKSLRGDFGASGGEHDDPRSAARAAHEVVR